MRILLIIISIFGVLLSIVNYSFRYERHFTSTGVCLILCFGLLILFISTLILSVREYNKTKTIKSFKLPFLCLAIGVVVFCMDYQRQYILNKPSFIKARYDKQESSTLHFSGIEIDLKKDGSYVLMNGKYSVVTYNYGKYTIEGDYITLDKDTIDGITDIKKLQIIEENNKEYLYPTSTNSPKDFKINIVSDN